ncbi:MotA/TolQ/ExbB proton channel family protein [Devosia algicola]|uniref:MotA/TolQ/ExbB proton channel family protein n=1 Tax=Devosia algicola TaxID=3026418 RepID=A0ABY7YJV0_9HYPH|nr:MotA/TolQ/ExbB proton channel family protein [Devosia algicola]WDR01583.1 MotA/TolQ/ExbB proton channel family protein [Devosia algicola]
MLLIRCGGIIAATSLAVVFEKPEVLGHAYQLISEELASGRDVSVSTGTMQTLIDSIQLRLDERRSLTQYIAGILILLGLIGTFIGLIDTLASVGKILGDLDISGTDPTTAIATLLGNLQIPLRGMAVGFSSSLFGAVSLAGAVNDGTLFVHGVFHLHAGF